MTLYHLCYSLSLVGDLPFTLNSSLLLSPRMPTLQVINFVPSLNRSCASFPVSISLASELNVFSMLLPFQPAQCFCCLYCFFLFVFFAFCSFIPCLFTHPNQSRLMAVHPEVSSIKGILCEVWCRQEKHFGKG